jgi:hypothetical protein
LDRNTEITSIQTLTLSKQIAQSTETISSQTMTLKQELDKLSERIRLSTGESMDTYAVIDEICLKISEQLPTQAAFIVESIRASMTDIDQKDMQSYKDIIGKLCQIEEDIRHNQPECVNFEQLFEKVIA